MAWTAPPSLPHAAGSCRKGTSTVTEQTGPNSTADAPDLAALRTELAGLQTEAATPGLDELDTMGTAELVAAMNAHNAVVQHAVEAAAAEIVLTIDARGAR